MHAAPARAFQHDTGHRFHAGHRLASRFGVDDRGDARDGDHGQGPIRQGCEGRRVHRPRRSKSYCGQEAHGSIHKRQDLIQALHQLAQLQNHQHKLRIQHRVRVSAVLRVQLIGDDVQELQIQ